jgi:hypothetical protein
MLGYLQSFALLSMLLGSWHPAGAYMMNHRPAVNYGAYCRGPGGEVHQKLSITEAIKDMRQYFQRQGLDITHITHDSRFVRADVIDKSGKVIDSVLLDSWTGRMRSVL